MSDVTVVEERRSRYKTVISRGFYAWSMIGLIIAHQRGHWGFFPILRSMNIFDWDGKWWGPFLLIVDAIFGPIGILFDPYTIWLIIIGVVS